MDNAKRFSKGLLNGFPLLRREIRVFLRSYKSFLCLFFFLTALLVIVYLNWDTFVRSWRPDMDKAAGARRFFSSLSNVLLFMIILIMPFLIAPSIVEEREKHTLELLISSPISVVQMVLAKLLSPLIYVFLLLTSSIPVLSLCLLGGGLGMEDVYFTYIIFLATAFVYSCLGLFCSTLRPRVYEVYLAAVGATFLLALAIPYHGSLWTYISEVRWIGGMSVNHSLQILSPFHVLSQILSPASRFSREGFLLVYVVIMLGISGILLMATFSRMKRIAFREETGNSMVDSEEGNGFLDIRERDYDISFDMTTQDGNPGLVLERRIQWFARLPVLLRLFYIALMLSVLTLPLASYQGSWLFLSLPFVSAAFFTLPLAATSISADRERETLSLLRTSLLSTRQIVYAKFIACLQYSFIIALALYLPGMLIQLLCRLIGYEVDLSTDAADTFAMVFYPVILFFSLVMYTALGLYCSAFFRQSNRALVVAGVVILSTLSAPFLIPKAQFFAFSASSYLVTFGLMFLSPLAGISTLFPPGSIKYLERSLFPIHNQGDIPYGFTIGQCVFFCVVTYFLFNRAVSALENRD